MSRAFRPSLDIGHLAPVTARVVSPDGRWLASGDYEGFTLIWEMATGRCRHRFWRGYDWVGGLTWSPDSQVVIAANHDIQNRQPPILTFWTVGSGRWLGSVPGYHEPVAYREDGTLVAGYSSEDRGLSILDPLSGESLRRIVFANHQHHFYPLEITPDGTQCVALCSPIWPAKGDELVVWNIDTGTLVRRSPLPFDTHGGCYNAELALSSDGRYAALANGGGYPVVIYDLREDRETYRWEGEGWPGDLRFAPDASVLAVSLRFREHGGLVRLYTVPEGAPVTSLGEGVKPGKIAFGPDGRALVLEGPDRILSIWAAKRHRVLRKLRATEYPALAVTWSPDGRYVAVCHADDRITVWEAASGSRVRTLHGPTGPSPALGYSPDGRFLHLYEARGSTHWDLSSEDVIRLRHDDLGFTGNDRYVYSRSPGGAFEVAHGWQDGKIAHGITLYGVGTRRQRTLNMPSDHEYPTSLGFSTDDRLVVGGSYDNGLCFWETETGEFLEWIYTPGPVHALAISPDQNLIAAGNSELLLYDRTMPGHQLEAHQGNGGYLRNNVPPQEFGDELDATQTGHTAGLTGVAFSPDGSRVATCGKEGALKIWDTASRRLLATMLVLPNDDNSASDEWISWSPEGLLAASPGADRWYL